MQLKKYLFLLLLLGSFQSIFGQVIDTSKLIFSNKVFFDFGQSDLTVEADSILYSMIDKISSLKNIEVRITAHTDAIGSNKNNFDLSKNRANAVRQSFIKNGIAETTIQTKIFGEEKPDSDNVTDEGRQLNRRATINIFQKVKLVALKGQVTDEKTGENIIAKVVVHTKEIKDSIQTDSLGNFETLLPLGAVAGVDIYAKDYFFETQMFKVKSNKSPNLTIPLKKIAVGEKVDIKNFYFVGNQAVLLKRSLPELPKLLKFMQLNDSLNIEIAGHINRPNYPPVDKLSWDYKLSVKRAKMVYDYLLENNIPEKRISFKGYGNFHMRFPRAKNEKEQALNRRVEIRIIEGT